MNDYTEILEFLTNEIGLNIDSIGLISVTSGISFAMKEQNISDIGEFLRLIQTEKKIFRALVDNIKVPETWFFRDLECYNFLNNYIIENRLNFTKSNPLRILSIPCSTGEEPYSIAMTAIDSGLNKEEIQILAVDISKDSLEKAKEGIYRNNSFRSEYKDFENRYFTNEGKSYKISNKVKELVSFEEANFVKNDFLEFQAKFDVIFSKNLLIYLSDDARKIVLKNINRLLKEDGVLLVGLSEISYFTRNGYDQIKYDMAFACSKSKADNQLIEKKFKVNSDIKQEIREKSRKTTKSNELNNTIRNAESKAEELIEKYTIANIKKLSDEGNFEEAEKICNTILNNEAYNVDILFYLGLINNAMEKSSVALDYFNKVVYLEPNHYEGLVHLSLLYDSLGNKNQSEIFRKRAERIYSKKTNISK